MTDMTQAPTPGPLSGDDELIERGLRSIRTYDAVRSLRDALTATTARLTGYDWNADPDAITKQQGDAFSAADRVFSDLDAAVAAHPDIDLPECDACNGTGKIEEPARMEGANQHSACVRSCDECDGCGFAPDESLAPAAPVETLGEMAAFWGNVVTGAGGAETLHPATADLVDRFAAELKSKLAKAEAKYGYLDDWSKPDWKDDLIESLAEHVQKGDPRDVAAYCAFAWHHGWSTSEVPDCFHRAPRHTDVVQALEPFAKAARMAGINSHNKPNLEQEAKRAVSWLDFSRAAKAIELLAAQPDTGKVEAGRVGHDRLKRAIADGFNNGYEQYDDLTATQRQRFDMAADAVLNLRPQPSGETREAVARIVEALEGSKDRGDSSVILSQSDLRALLSARPAPVASGGKHSSGEGAAWTWLNGHVECDPADRDYSADEMVDAFMAGAGRYDRWAKALERIAGEHQHRSGYCQTDITVEPALTAEEAQTVARDALSGTPVQSTAPVAETAGEAEYRRALIADLRRYHGDCTPSQMGYAESDGLAFALEKAIEALSTPPAPAQDDDKLRIAVEEALADVEYVPGDHPIVPVKHDRFVKAIRHALKSTAAQEGGE